MKIGIDFDNTIAKYDKLFINVALSEGFIDAELSDYDKIALRDYLRKQPDGETSWMKLQGLVYGQYMSAAELMPSFARFLKENQRRSPADHSGATVCGHCREHCLVESAL